jgi:hypothetical protein
MQDNIHVLMEEEAFQCTIELTKQEKLLKWDSLD